MTRICNHCGATVRHYRDNLNRVNRISIHDAKTAEVVRGYAAYPRCPNSKKPLATHSSPASLEETTCHECGDALNSSDDGYRTTSGICEKCVRKALTTYPPPRRQCPACGGDLEQYGIGDPPNQECTHCGCKEASTGRADE